MPRVLPDTFVEADYPVDFGRYRLLGLLGEGGMARVYRAELRGPDGFTKRVALKVVRAAVATKGESLRRALINEARLGGLMDHPNLVQTLDFGDVEGLPFIAMGLVRGMGLDRLLASDHEILPEIAIEIATQIAAGLEHAHSLQDGGAGQLVHRDLKPSNVIVDTHGLVKVLDFGIAKATSLTIDQTEAGQTKGTPSYMSPEQANGEPLDRRSDIFSLGSLLYELVTGDKLFASSSPLATLKEVVLVEERLADPEFGARLRSLAPGLDIVLTRCLRFDPAARYSDCGELGDELRTVAARIPPAPPLRTWIRETMEALGHGERDPAGLSIGFDSSPSDDVSLLWATKESTDGGVGPTRIQDSVGARIPREPEASSSIPPVRDDEEDNDDEEDDQVTDIGLAAIDLEALSAEPADPPPVDVGGPSASPSRPTARRRRRRAAPPPKRSAWRFAPYVVIVFLLGLVVGGLILILGGDDEPATVVSAPTDAQADSVASPPADEPGQDALADLAAPPPVEAPVDVAATEEATEEATASPPKSTGPSRRATSPSRPATKPRGGTTVRAVPPPETAPEGDAAEVRSKPSSPSAPSPTKLNVQLGERGDGWVSLVFTAELDASENSELFLHYKEPSKTWQKVSMSSMGSGNFFSLVRLDPLPADETIRYYLTGKVRRNPDAIAVRVTDGNRGAPHRYSMP